MSNSQYGFRKGRSTTHAIFELIKYKSENVKNHHYVTAIFLDMAKAFDSISHHILLGKLESIGLHRVLWKWLASYLGNRKIRTKLNNTESNTVPLRTGIPQGSCLGPQLFLIYINALASVASSENCHVLLYADDAVIYTAGQDVETIQQSLQSVSQRISSWCIKNIFSEKSKICMYGTNSMLKHIPNLEIQINNRLLSNCHVYDYLGVLLDENLSMNNHYNWSKKNFALRQYNPLDPTECNPVCGISP